MRTTDHRQHELGVEQLPIRSEQGEEQQPEADEHEPVRRADEAPLKHSGVAERLAKHRDRAAAGLIGPAEHWLAESDDADDLTNRTAG